MRFLVLLWLAGGSLRVTVLAVPPLLTAIHRDLHLDETTVGILTGLPVLLLGGGAVFGSLLVARLGARRALILGLCTIALAGALRGVGPNVAVLMVMTFIMGLGVSVSQPVLPALVRRWAPSRTGTATALYANGLLVGEILAASLTAPLILPLVGGSWEWALAVWSIPVAGTAVVIMLLTEHDSATAVLSGARWWPDWRSSLTLRLGFVLGCASAAYFGSNAFVPDYLKAMHRADLIPAALTALNLLQLPASIVTALLPHRVVGRRWPIACAGLGVLVSTLGLSMGGLWVVGWAGVIGLSTATVLVLTLALPPLVAEEHDVHRLTAAMFTITYVCSFVGTLVGGAIWDSTGVPISSFLPVAFAGIAMIALVSRLDLSLARRAYTELSVEAL